MLKLKLLETREDVNKFVSSNKVAVIVYTDPSSELGKHIISVLKRLEALSKGEIMYGVYPHAEGDRPVIRMYYRGSTVFEQKDCFGIFQLDYRALKLGFRNILQARGQVSPF